MQELEAAITVCFSHAQIDSQVETLDNAARKGFASFEIVHQQFLVSSEGLDEFLHRFESAAHGALTPSPEEPAGPVGAFVLPEGIEGFLEMEVDLSSKQTGPRGPWKKFPEADVIVAEELTQAPASEIDPY